jgi:hypothetical protein
MENSKIKRLISLIFVVFIVSLVFTLVDSYPWNLSSYDLGKSTGLMMRHLIKILVMLALIMLIIRTFRIERLDLLILILLLSSFIFTIASSNPWNLSSFEFGKLAGKMFARMIENLLTLGLIYLSIKRFKLDPNRIND